MIETNLKWAILGCGEIANEMASVLMLRGIHFYGVCNRTQKKAVDFAKKYQIEKVYETTDALFADKDVDVIYIATPHNTHYQYMKKALLSGKHIFVEKAITLNSAQLDEMIKLADENGLMIGEAMTIWHMPLIERIASNLVQEKLGKVNLITLNFGSFKEYNLMNRFFNLELGGGALLDIGVYAISFARAFMDSAPNEVKSFCKKSETGSDEMSTIILQNESGQMATIALSIHSKQPKRAVLSCENGYVEIMDYPRAEKATIVDAVTGEKEEISMGHTADALSYEIIHMEEAIMTGNKSLLKIDKTKDVMDIMTRLRKEWNLVYPEEK